MRVDIYGAARTRTEHPSTEFVDFLQAQCQQLGVVLDLRAGQFISEDATRRVAVVLADKDSTWSDREEAGFAALLKAGVTVLPVVADAPSAAHLPKSLSHINAFLKKSYGRVWPLCLADEVLSMAWLHRRARKVFISYKRADSSPIAMQLFERFNCLGYETFLDEASVKRGADFQRELKWSLNDADLLIVLASPRFALSKWCMEEVTFCQRSSIGIALVNWPEEIYSGRTRLKFPGVSRTTGKPSIAQATMSDQEFVLKPTDFAGVRRTWAGDGNPDLTTRKLSAAALDRVIGMSARARTVAIRQRIYDLIPLAQKLLPNTLGVSHGDGLGDLTFDHPGNKRSFVRILPFRPAAENIHQACIAGAAHKVAGCFYAENDPDDPRAQALRWLASGKRKVDSTVAEGNVWATYGSTLL